MAEVIWTIKAVEQVEQIGAFIEKDSPFQSRRVVQLIVKEARKLKRYPRIANLESSATEFSTKSLMRKGLSLWESFMVVGYLILNGWNETLEPFYDHKRKGV